jgi:hypothetical protein
MISLSSLAVWLGPAGVACFALILLAFFVFFATSRPPRRMLTEAYNPSSAERNHYSSPGPDAIDSPVIRQ